MSDYEHTCTDDVVCPHCFHEHSDSWEFNEDEEFTKFKSMIDNYCEHVNDPRFNATPFPGLPRMCMKCERFYG